MTAAHEASVGAMLARQRREDLAAQKKCINSADHGPPWNGRVRCQWCVWVHRYGLVAVLEMSDAPPRPPNYVPNIRKAAW